MSVVLGYAGNGIAEEMLVYTWLCLLWYSRTDEFLYLIMFFVVF
jgi:hypothetical protein